MEKDIIEKIRNIVDSRGTLNEDQTRSLMILIRKRLELMPEIEAARYLVLNLFCNWSAHTVIKGPNTGFRILAKVNDALVKVKDSNNTEDIIGEITQAIGFNALKLELTNFFNTIKVTPTLVGKDNWTDFLKHLIEIIRDVPLQFPSTNKLSKSARKIYNGIALNPLRPGAGVISIKISRINYSALGATNIGEILCLLIRTEETTTFIIPLKI